ncbi:1321_t:CDS:2 [Entrophospora sp. SA101]|nr:1321_t:CDS:2 [Entrophospora sp. SA101]
MQNARHSNDEANAKRSSFSECGKPGHNSRNCPKNKKKSKSGHSSKCKSGSSSKHKSKKKGSVNIATRKGKSSPNKIPKSRKTKQKGVATSSRGRAPLQSRPLGDESEIQDSVSSSNHKSQNKSTTLEQNIHRILLDMLEKVLLPHQLEKLKSEDKYLTTPDFINN